MPDGRWLDREAVARHISVRVDEVAKLLRAGKLPAPSYHLGPKSPRWDRGSVDARFEGALGSTGGGHEAIVQAGIESILRG